MKNLFATIFFAAFLLGAQESKDSTTGSPALPNSSSSTFSSSQALSSSHSDDPLPPAAATPTNITFNSSVSLGVMSLPNDQTATRFTYRPQIGVGHFGIALDLEFFWNNSTGRPTLYGWEFNTRDKTINSIYRKIFYLRWNHPGAAFYARAGALQGITLDVGGLVTAGWGNLALYPSRKLLGTHIQFNNWFSPWNFSFEAVTNSWQDWSEGGGVLGLKSSFDPLGFLQTPLFSHLKLGAIVMSDFDQTSGHSSLGFVHKRDPFTLWALDANTPLVRSKLFSLNIYTEFAKPYIDTETRNKNVESLNNIANSWGVVLPGLSGHLYTLNWKLDYRILHGVFQPSHFNANYEMERFLLNTTREKRYWIDPKLDPNKSRKGVYTQVSFPLEKIAYITTTYSYLWAPLAEQSYTSLLGLGSSILDYIPKIDRLEIFFNKALVGWDNDDGFFAPSIYTNYGYRLGFEMKDGMSIVGTALNIFTRAPPSLEVPNPPLRVRTNFSLETVLSF